MARDCEFEDRLRRLWRLDIDVPTVERVEKDTGVRLTDLIDPAKLDELYARDAKFVEVLFALCEEQTAARGVTPEQFGRGFDRDALERAAEAFEAALILFTPSRRRAVLAAALEKKKALEGLAAERAMEAIEAATLESEPAATAPAWNGAASSDSTPAPAG